MSLKKKANIRVRDELQKRSVPYWILADRLGCSTNTVYRMLLHELPEAKQDELIELIETIAEEE